MPLKSVKLLFKECPGGRRRLQSNILVPFHNCMVTNLPSEAIQLHGLDSASYCHSNPGAIHSCYGVEIIKTSTDWRAWPLWTFCCIAAATTGLCVNIDLRHHCCLGCQVTIVILVFILVVVFGSGCTVVVFQVSANATIEFGTCPAQCSGQIQRFMYDLSPSSLNL